MGVIYKARDARLARVVALKFLPPELTRDPEAKERFVQEARAASSLDHPNLCTILELGETPDGRLYLAMPCYDGETLRRRIERGPLPVPEAVDIAAQIARGLAKAHRTGIVHRDVKPANVIVTSRRGGEDPRLRPRQAGGLGGGSLGKISPAPRPARPPTCPPSRRGGTRWTPAPISGRSASCSTRCWPAAAPSAASASRR